MHARTLVIATTAAGAAYLVAGRRAYGRRVAGTGESTRRWRHARRRHQHHHGHRYHAHHGHHAARRS